MRSYRAARAYFSNLEFLSFCVVILGILVAGGSLLFSARFAQNFPEVPNMGFMFLAMLPGLAVAFIGFMGLVLSQIGRAGVDSAEYGQQSLKVSREQLEISRQRMMQGAIAEPSYAAIEAAKREIRHGLADPAPSSYGHAPAPASVEPGTTPLGGAINYEGQTIRAVEGGYVFGKAVFDTLEEAKAQIRALSSKDPSSTLQTPSGGVTLGGATRS